MIGWLFGVGLRRPVAIKRRRYGRATRRWVRQHQAHGLNSRGGMWWCRPCRVTHYPRVTTRWRIN